MSNATPPAKTHTDRCFNPFGSPGHVGTDLRKISKKMSEKFPNVSKSARVCSECRRRANSKNSTEARGSTEQQESEDSDIHESPEVKKKCLSREDQLEELLFGLKQKLASLDERDPLCLSILTIAPNCWSVRDIEKEFHVSRRMAQAAKKLKKEEGVLAMPQSKKGKTLPESTVQKVREFYDDDEYSRVMPNKKDVISVTINGQREKIRKRLLLCDIKSLHVKFKEQFPNDPIGFSKFAELRPQWCVLAGARGTHSVCVCVSHQNFKTRFDAAELSKLTKNSQHPLKHYTDCISSILCRNANPDCYLGDCKSCPKIENFADYVTATLKDNGITELTFSTWQMVDRCLLRKECLLLDDFVEEFTSDLEKLLPHHYIAKNQSKYVKERKENLKEDEVLLHGDFSENYAYVAQNAAQAFHYNNEQCTVHPVIFYYKSGDEVKHQSIILLSDSTTHDTAAVYIMQQNVIPLIKKVCPKVKEIIYVSDGAKQHYKNRFQMINLISHKEDFDLDAEWHFYATAHGKGACDGIGAVFKKEATRASLQAKPTESILDLKSLVKWAKMKFKSITFFEYSKQDHARTQRSLNKRFSAAPKVTRITDGHEFQVTTKRELKVMRYSGAPTPLATINY